MLSRAASTQDLQDELKNVLSMFREKRPKLDIIKTPEVFISQKSNPDEVQSWLEAKGFSEKIRKQLRDVSGSELFSLTKSQLEKYCGKDEGRRLDSQLTVQRNISGYKTTRSQELRDALARVREKAEGTQTESAATKSPVKVPQKPAFEEYNQEPKRHTLTVEPSDFGSDESDGSEDESNGTHLSTLLKSQLRKMSLKD